MKSTPKWSSILGQVLIRINAKIVWNEMKMKTTKLFSQKGEQVRQSLSFGYEQWVEETKKSDRKGGGGEEIKEKASTVLYQD